ncbi:L-aspartate oxidase [Desulfobacula toluolica]|uniref:L-aspartate oxidase n=1 Tax=Desulfobacula toluolica (strain DSM 7467 / Tol2) TaxID=651182 RepID=K0NMF4_DESTT|nr:L-aspartate oxidase [Desulfobacula toluolica]CCK81865.1 NadB: L-aspartate oxidase [Desulfobacula toluolica Tol2]
MIKRTDFLVIGSGIAGLSYALKVSEFGKVTIITKKKIQKTNTALAQGGIAAVFSSIDSFDLHIQDTLGAGDGLCNKDVVKMVVENGPDRIKELVRQGAHFNKDGEGEYDFALGKEGGHSVKRIVYAHDLTGKEIEDTLVKNVEENENITILEDHIAVNLITFSSSIRSGLVVTQHENICCGAYVLDNKTGKIETFYAGVTLLSTGGAGKVYLYTSNPDIATGDGIAMAYRAGASVANLEFVQFHPTCLYHPEAKNFLISEAVRGEGAVLIDSKGRRFMEKYAPEKELACRDVVARAIDSELKKTGADAVFLDITHKDPEFIKKRFPNIYAKCLEYGIDMTKDPIPVVPAAHYMCGGVATDLNGKTDVQRLYAVGETACTGLHGANRLASNSLLEALVYSHRAYQSSVEEFESIDNKITASLDPWDETDAADSDEAIVLSHNWDEIRRLMWNYVGIVRSDKRLQRALRRIQNINEEINEYYWDFKVTSDLIEIRNLATVAELIIKSALMRKESRGLHYNIEYPEKDDLNGLQHTILKKTF